MLKEISTFFTYFIMKFCDLLGEGDVAGILRVWILHAAGLRRIHPHSKMLNECIIHDVNDKISIGKYSFINKNVFFDYSEGTYIGQCCNIGFNTIFTNAKPFLKKKKSILKNEPIIVEKNVSIGCNCIILSGVTIGTGAVVASGSIVVQDIPQNALAAGRPAKVVKYLKLSENKTF